MNATRALNPARATTFTEAVSYLLSGGETDPGPIPSCTFCVTPILPNDILQYTRDLAEKIVPSAGRHRDHYCVTIEQEVVGNVVTTRDSSGAILPCIVAVPL